MTGCMWSKAILLVAVCTAVALTIGDANAIMAPCTIAHIDQQPAHPGSTDVIRLDVGYVDTYLGDYVYSRESVDGSTVSLDVVSSTRSIALPGYRASYRQSFEFQPALLGPLPSGQYDVVITLRSYDPTTGSAQSVCAPLETNLIVRTKPGPTTRGTVVEYYNETLDRYFDTLFANEIERLDASGDWRRTGQTFLAYVPNGSDRRGQPVAREYFWWPSGAEAHFLMWDGRESLLSMPDAEVMWTIETFDAFEILIPDSRDGSCPLDTIRVYRLRNAGVESAVRYTTDLAIRATMIAHGYVPDGYGLEGTVMCALLPDIEEEMQTRTGRPLREN